MRRRCVLFTRVPEIDAGADELDELDRAFARCFQRDGRVIPDDDFGLLRRLPDPKGPRAAEVT